MDQVLAGIVGRKGIILRKAEVYFEAVVARMVAEASGVTGKDLRALAFTESNARGDLVLTVTADPNGGYRTQAQALVVEVFKAARTAAQEGRALGQ